MTETIKQKALALLNEARAKLGFPPFDRCDRSFYAVEALCRAIEQHESFKREVSDAVEDVVSSYGLPKGCLARFIIAKPDPLVDAVDELWTQDRDKAKYMADQLHKYLAARGLEVRKIGEGE